MDLQQKVQDVLDRAVENGTECGCQAALYINGELAVNAYSGWTDWTKKQKVDENTIFPVFSSGKPPSSTVLHRLVEMGKLSYDDRIADFWPEFGCCGKEDMRVWHVLSYRAALFTVPECTEAEMADFEVMTEKIARMKPAYQFGTRQQYHAVTYGWLTGGIACHLLGRKDYFDIFGELVGGPAGMDRFYYGIPADETNIGTLVKARDSSCYKSPEWFARMNSALFRTSCNPAICTMSNALSLARHYAAIDTEKIMTKETRANAVSLKWRAPDDPFSAKKGRWDLFGLGYVLSGPADDVCQIFGHGGLGGSEAVLDQKRHYAIAITRNCFAEPSVLRPFYEAVDFKNRDWPDTSEVPIHLG